MASMVPLFHKMLKQNNNIIAHKAKPFEFEGAFWHPEWFLGFVDGDGHFSRAKENNSGKNIAYRYRFIVSQDISSSSVLYAFQAFFKCGFVHKAGGNMMEYSVGNSQDLAEIIIPFFEQNYLKTEAKFNQFHIWRKEFLYDKTGEVSVLDLNIKDRHLAHEHRPINKEWLAGFIDAEGCFYVGICKHTTMKMGHIVLPKFFISQNDSIVCNKILALINGGRCRKYKNTWMFEVSALKDHNNILNILPIQSLKTKKKRRIFYGVR